MKTPLSIIALAALCGSGVAAKTSPAFTETFGVEKGDLTSIGTNRFFILAPGYQLVLQGREKGKATELTITVLNETRMVDGVETRIIEERETMDGQLEEVSRNFFAISRRTADIYYFGEEVDMYKNGKITTHEGAWLSGEKGARFGLGLPGTPLLGARYYQEIAPKVAMDRAEVISVKDELNTPAGKFSQCLKTEETSAIEGGKENKVYAPGVGLIFDGQLKLTKFGYTR